MNTSLSASPGDQPPSGDVTQLLSGLESQKAELGPIADELLALLHELGVSESPPEGEVFSPSRG